MYWQNAPKSIKGRSTYYAAKTPSELYYWIVALTCKQFVDAVVLLYAFGSLGQETGGTEKGNNMQQRPTHFHKLYSKHQCTEQ